MLNRSDWHRFWVLLHRAAVLLAWFTATWWWRPTQLPDEPFYFARFGFAPLVALALVAWAAGGFRGVVATLGDGRWVWALLLVQLALWARLTYGDDVRNAQVALSAAAQLMVVAVFALSVLASPPPPSWIVATLGAALLLQGVLGVAQVALQRAVGIAAWDWAGLGISELSLDPAKPGISVIGAARYLRPYGLSAHPNLLAGGVVLGICALVGALPRRWAVGLLVVGWWVLLLTFSRAALVSALVGVGFFIAMRRTTPRLLLRVALLLGVVTLVFGLFYAPLVRGRLGLGKGAAPTFETYSAASRAVYVEQARQLVGENPILGVGIGNFSWESAYLLVSDPRDLRGDHVHNVYLLALAEVGGVGFALYMAVLALGMGLAWRRRAALTTEQLGLWAGLVAWLVIGLFDHYPWTQFGHQLLFWGLFAALLGQNQHAVNRAEHFALDWVN